MIALSGEIIKAILKVLHGEILCEVESPELEKKGKLNNIHFLVVYALDELTSVFECEKIMTSLQETLFIPVFS